MDICFDAKLNLLQISIRQGSEITSFNGLNNYQKTSDVVV
jgi:hypothetical protein